MKNSIIKHDCNEELKNADLKITPARLGILEALENSNTPVDAATLINYLEEHKVKADKVTVFRILNALIEKGIAKSIELNEGKNHFEYARANEHHHFVCESCGLIEDVSDCNLEILEKIIKKKKGLLIKRHSLEFFGLCQSCQL
jgi:Fur family transcriptional regulator, ferric uptake regulator